MSAFALIPSQVPCASEIRATALHANAESDSDSSAGDQVVYNAIPALDASTDAASSASTEKQNCRKRIRMPRTGNLPDVHWRAISMSHLRSHPNFQPLPPPDLINELPTKEHVRNFRQDSWQWDYLHTGRCTTSQCSAALGFLEPKAAQFLGIPKSLQRGGVSAWNRLSQDPDEELNSLTGMEQTLCEGRSAREKEEGNAVGSWRPSAKESDRLWVPSYKLRINALRTKPFPFTAKYIPSITFESLHERKMYLQQDQQSPSPMKARMQWGNAQEATSILTALNYFCSTDRNTVVHEVGMCGAEFDDETDDTLQGVKIGASPDAIICHGNGIVEVLEVKNHCPFVWNRVSPHFTGVKKKNNNSKKKKNGKKKKTDEKNNADERREDREVPKHYLIRDFQLERQIPPMYIPQLMMEMLCVGDSVNLDQPSESKQSSPICTSAVMVRQTATKGAILLRLKRDEEWIQEMKYYLGEFQMRYVKTGKIPNDNFFWDDDPSSRYRKFLQRTKDLSNGVEQIAFIDHGRIQRAVIERGVKGEVPLFLDRVEEECDIE